MGKLFVMDIIVEMKHIVLILATVMCGMVFIRLI